jgi:hypothetical protein
MVLMLIEAEEPYSTRFFKTSEAGRRMVFGWEKVIAKRGSPYS